MARSTCKWTRSSISKVPKVERGEITWVVLNRRGRNAHEDRAFGRADAKIVGRRQAHARHSFLDFDDGDKARHVAVQPGNTIFFAHSLHADET
jgi:hypothetical protein